MISGMGIGLLPPGVTRDTLKAQMTALPPVDPADVATLVANADLVRDDYAEAAIEVVDATPAGKKSKILRYGVGCGIGLALGFVIGKLV